MYVARRVVELESTAGLATVETAEAWVPIVRPHLKVLAVEARCGRAREVVRRQLRRALDTWQRSASELRL